MPCRFSHDETIRQQCHQFTSEAQKSLRSSLENPSIDVVRACILVGDIASAKGEQSLESLYFGIAVRMSQSLHLNEDTSGSSLLVDTEVTRRNLVVVLHG